jgi:hypothetical protein
MDCGGYRTQRPANTPDSSPGRGFCGMMFPSGKPVAEPTSHAIQARRAMAYHGPSILVLNPLVRSTFLQLRPSQSHSSWCFSSSGILSCEARFF